MGAKRRHIITNIYDFVVDWLGFFRLIFFCIAALMMCAQCNAIGTAMLGRCCARSYCTVANCMYNNYK